jgi:hypothetical protein
MNQMKEILAKYTNQIAVRAVEMEEENAAIVLYVLSGALDEGSDAQLAELCHRFCVERMKDVRVAAAGDFSLN